jgi:hypothetical protein
VCIQRDDGYVATGLCPGGANNLCCNWDNHCGTRGTGRCQYRPDYNCRGTWQQGFCPGNKNWQCCN